MKLVNFLAVTVGVTFATNISAGTFTIGGFSFDEKNTVKTAAIVQGPALIDHSNTRFGRFSEAYVTSPTTRENAFEKFNREKSVGRLLGKVNKKGIDYARQVSFPDIKNAPPTPNVDRAVLELTWGEGKGLSNGSGRDFVVFEASSWEGFEVAVLKAGATEFTPYRYQFPTAKDSIHDVNAVAFDLSDFGVNEGDMISAIRIRNIFTSKATSGGDKVDNESGQGMVLEPKDSNYDKAFEIRTKAGGPEFGIDQLGADIVYVTALHDIENLRPPEPTPAPEAAAPTPSPAPELKSSGTNTAPKK